MQTIHIPQVTLVDASGKYLGLYHDEPDWWQDVQANDRKASHILGELARKSFMHTSTTDMKSQLINDSNDEIESENMRKDIKTLMDNMDSSENDKLLKLDVIGETLLHIAIILDDIETIKHLIEQKGYDVNQRAVKGEFAGGFNSQVTLDLIEECEYEVLAYYGEYPLALAAVFENKEIYDYLIDKGADPNLQDFYGNSVAHVLVINDKADMLTYAIRHHKRKSILTIKNNQELTAINLAAKLGRTHLFEKFLDLTAVELSKVSDVTRAGYPLDGIDSIGKDGEIVTNSALNYIVDGDSDDHLDMLVIGVIKRLLDVKWEAYVRRRFIQRLIISIIELVFMSVAVYLRAGLKTFNEWPPQSSTTWAKIIVVIACCLNIYFQIQEIYSQNFKSYLHNLGGDPANVFHLSFSIFMLVAFIFRFAYINDKNGVTNADIENVLVIIAVPAAWFHLLFYFKVAEITGPFVVMIYKMIIGDLFNYFAIYGNFLIGFTVAFYYLYQTAGTDLATMASVLNSLYQTYMITLGQFTADQYPFLYYSDFIKCVFVGLLMFVHILLLNMFIGMIGNTYQNIIEKSEKEWGKQVAKIVLQLERSYPSKELKKFREMYVTKIPMGCHPNVKYEDVLVFTRKGEKTKAALQLQSYNHWMKCRRKVINLLRHLKYNAVQLNDWWDKKNQKSVKPRRHIPIFQNRAPLFVLRKTSDNDITPKDKQDKDNLATEASERPSNLHNAISKMKSSAMNKIRSLSSFRNSRKKKKEIENELAEPGKDLKNTSKDKIDENEDKPDEQIKPAPEPPSPEIKEVIVKEENRMSPSASIKNNELTNVEVINDRKLSKPTSENNVKENISNNSGTRIDVLTKTGATNSQKTIYDSNEIETPTEGATKFNTPKSSMSKKEDPSIAQVVSFRSSREPSSSSIDKQNKLECTVVNEVNNADKPNKVETLSRQNTQVYVISPSTIASLEQPKENRTDTVELMKKADPPKLSVNQTHLKIGKEKSNDLIVTNLLMNAADAELKKDSNPTEVTKVEDKSKLATPSLFAPMSNVQNKYLANQTVKKIYPMVSSSFSSVTSMPGENPHERNSRPTTPYRGETPKMDLNDIRRPHSSVIPDELKVTYIKKDTYPKFPIVRTLLTMKNKSTKDEKESEDKNQKK